MLVNAHISAAVIDSDGEAIYRDDSCNHSYLSVSSVVASSIAMPLEINRFAWIKQRALAFPPKNNHS